MKIFTPCSKFLALLALLASYPAMAQDAAPAPAPAPAAPEVAVPTVPAEAQVQPAAQAPVTPLVNVGSPGFFPALPPSRPCEAQDVNGTWLLKQVYENPIGKEMDSFSTQPYQYIQFDDNNMFGDYRTAYNEHPQVIAQGLQSQESAQLTQYVLSQGFLYFYKNSVASDTEACFIVANRSNPFNIGQMLLMPPADQTGVTGRRVKVFERAQSAGNANTNNNNNRRRGRRKRNQQNQQNQ